MPVPLQVVAYKMKEYQLPLEEALASVKSNRSCINPNDGFIQQLKAYEGILRARLVGISSYEMEEVEGLGRRRGKHIHV